MCENSQLNNFCLFFYIKPPRTIAKGKWKIKKEYLHYNFKQTKQFLIPEITKETLVLEFTQKNSKGTLQHHFTAVSNEESPFIAPANELPQILVESTKRKWWDFFSKKKKKKNIPEEKQVYISIELTGGGYYGGINPVTRDYIQINSSGRLIRELKSEHNGLIINKRDIPRIELEKLMDYILSKNYFEMNRIYDCESFICMERKKRSPKPIPLRIAIAHGNHRKVITIPIFGEDEHQIRYIDYPIELDQIIAAIQKMVHRFK